MRTITKELAIKLKEAGFPQKMAFSYRNDGLLIYQNVVQLKRFEYYAAPTADEILELLPKEIIGDEGMRFDLNIYADKDTKAWVIAYWWDEDSRKSSGMVIQDTCSYSFTNALAEMWLYLKENHLLKEDTNEANKEVSATSEA